MPQRELADLVARDFCGHLVGLAMECPVTKNNPPDCQLHQIRLLPLAKRWEWARSRTRAEAEEILSCHLCCRRMNQDR